MDDQKIIELFFKRCEEAIAATSEKYGKMCRSISDRILKNNEDVEECVNDTYLTLVNTPDSRPILYSSEYSPFPSMHITPATISRIAVMHRTTQRKRCHFIPYFFFDSGST